MGVCQPVNHPPSPDKEIERDLKKAKRLIQKEVKLLLLGAGDSGKSTVAKQLKVIHLNGFTLAERQAFTFAVVGNLLTCVQCLLRGAKRLGFTFPPDRRSTIEEIFQLNGLDGLTSDLIKEIIRLLSLKKIKRTLRRSYEFYIPDSAFYFFQNSERILSEDFIPNEEDIIRTRIKTMGVNEISFAYLGNNFRVVDVGGQRSERRKWIHCFQDISSIIFCVALSEYNLSLEEDETVNRMHESIQMFREICTTIWFKDVTLIIFLNKEDIFKLKIDRIPLTICFPDCAENCTYDEGIRFIKSKFENEGKGVRKVYSHVTNSTETECIRYVFHAIKDYIISQLFGSV
jgi:GTPase SAR1 family protein